MSTCTCSASNVEPTHPYNQTGRNSPYTLGCGSPIQSPQFMTHLLPKPLTLLSSITMTSTRMNGDTKAVTSTCPSPTIPSCSLDITLSDSYNTLYQESRWDETSKSWSYTDAAKDIPAEPVQSIGAHTMNSDSWKEYCFVFVQKHSKPSEDSDSKFLPSPYPPTPAITFEIFLINSHLVKACQDVMGDIRGVSWNSQPIKVSIMARSLNSHSSNTYHATAGP